MTDSECSQTFLLGITLASFAFKGCSLVISRRYPLISHTHTIVLSVPGDEKHHFWVVQACVVLPSREFSRPGSAGFHQCQVADVHTCLLHLYILNSSCRAATGDPCQFLAGFCCYCSACAECSERSNGHRGRRQRLASSIQPLSIPIVRCSNHPFWDLLMVSCRLELCNPLYRPTHISGAGLGCIFISSGHVVDVVVHDGLQFCRGVCCPVLGSDHFLCIAAGLSLPTRPDPVRGPTLPPLRDWRPTLIRAHAELLQWGTRVQDLCQSSPPSRRQLLDGVFKEMIAILHLHAPTQRCHRRRPSWWTPERHQCMCCSAWCLAR